MPSCLERYSRFALVPSKLVLVVEPCLAASADQLNQVTLPCKTTLLIEADTIAGIHFRNTKTLRYKLFLELKI